MTGSTTIVNHSHLLLYSSFIQARSQCRQEQCSCIILGSHYFNTTKLSVGKFEHWITPCSVRQIFSNNPNQVPPIARILLSKKHSPPIQPTYPYASIISTLIIPLVYLTGQKPWNLLSSCSL
jgi:hypothetical protein